MFEKKLVPFVQGFLKARKIMPEPNFNISAYWNSRNVRNKNNEILTICNVRGKDKYQDITYSQASEIVSELKYEWIYGIRKEQIKQIHQDLQKFIDDVNQEWRKKGV